MTTIIGTARNDDLLGTVSADLIFGDTDGTLTSGRGGNDQIDGGGNEGGGTEWVYGDADVLSGTARGGNDRIEAAGPGYVVIIRRRPDRRGPSARRQRGVAGRIICCRLRCRPRCDAIFVE